MPKGIKGFVKGYKQTEEHKQKLSIARKGRKLAEGHKQKIADALKGNKCYSEEYKQKLRLAMKGNQYKLGTKDSEETKRKRVLSRSGYKHSEETREKMSISSTGKKHTQETIGKLRAIRGEKTSNWKGGITLTLKIVRKSFRYKQWRQEIFIRDNFICQECGDRGGGNLEAHHKKPFSVLVQEARNYMPLLTVFEACMAYIPLWDIDNGKTLCKKCHLKTRINLTGG